MVTYVVVDKLDLFKVFDTDDKPYQQEARLDVVNSIK